MERDLTKLSESEHQDAIARLARLPLRELRRRQELVEKQKAQAGRNRVGPHSVAWRNLDVMETHLTQAILQKEFPNDEDVRRGATGLRRNGTRSLDSIKILFRLPDTLALYGIPYDLRPGQSPKDLHGRYREGWIFLGYPGWAGPISEADAQEINEFLAKHEGNIPQGPYEWTRLEPELPFVNVGDRKDTMNVRIANPGDYNLRGSLFYFSFGAYGDLHVLVWSRGVEAALETAAEYMIDEGHKGIFVDDEELKRLAVEAREALGPDASDDEIYEKGTVDLTYTESGYIPSWEWWVDEITDPGILAAAKSASEAYDKRTDLSYAEDDEELS